jgi:hypothetical protein
VTALFSEIDAWYSIYEDADNMAMFFARASKNAQFHERVGD